MHTTHNILRSCLALGILLGTGTLTTVHAQGGVPGQPPAAVQAAFAKAYPDAMRVHWKMQGTQYEAEFKTGILLSEHEVWYEADGRMVRHEEEIAASDLPEPVRNAIASEFPGFLIEEAERVTAAGTTSYVVELKMKDRGEWKVAYDPQGRQLEKRTD